MSAFSCPYCQMYREKSSLNWIAKEQVVRSSRTTIWDVDMSTEIEGIIFIGICSIDPVLSWNNTRTSSFLISSFLQPMRGLSVALHQMKTFKSFNLVSTSTWYLEDCSCRLIPTAGRNGSFFCWNGFKNKFWLHFKFSGFKFMILQKNIRTDFWWMSASTRMVLRSQISVDCFPLQLVWSNFPVVNVDAVISDNQGRKLRGRCRWKLESL